MIRANRIKEKLGAGKPILMCTLCSNDPIHGELFGMVGVEMTVLDTEHMCFTEQQIADVSRAVIAGGAEAIIRTTSKDERTLSHYLDLGVSGILATDVKSYEDVVHVIDGVKYPPIGKRGIGIGCRAYDYSLHDLTVADYMKKANENTYLGVVIEGHKALKEIDKILAFDCIDSVHFGLNDLSVEMGFEGDTKNPELTKMVEEAKKKVIKSGKKLSYPVKNPEDIPAMVEKGAQILKLSSDMAIIRQALLKYRRAIDEM